MAVRPGHQQQIGRLADLRRLGGSREAFSVFAPDLLANNTPPITIASETQGHGPEGGRAEQEGKLTVPLFVLRCTFIFYGLDFSCFILYLRLPLRSLLPFSHSLGFGPALLLGACHSLL